MQNSCSIICDGLRDSVRFHNLKKREKHLWRSSTFSKVVGQKPATLLKVALLHGCFSRFLSCTNGTKSRKTSYIKGLRSLLRYSAFNVLNHSINFESFDVMKSIRMRATVYFGLFILNQKSLGHDFWSANRHSHEQNYR